MNNLFDKIYCINLDKRKDNWEECKKEFEKFSIDSVCRISAVDGEKLFETGKYPSKVNAGNRGLVLSNIKIFEEAKDKKLENILIMEDDVSFSDDINQISELMKLVPEDWDLIYFGANHCTQEGKEPPHKINDRVVKCHYSKATHCIGFNSRTFDFILENLKKHNLPIDVIYIRYIQSEFNVYSFFPALAEQRPGYSDIQSRNCNYKKFIK
jgi:GR25 family glycosyltransferase involved in LPS biosynthesis